MTAQPFDTTTTINRLSNKLLPVFTGKLLPILFLTIIMILYSRKLSYSDYGQFQTVWLYSNIISVVISFGLSSIILSTGVENFSRFINTNRQKISLLYGLGALTSFTIFYFTTHHFASNTRLLLIIFILLQTACTLTDTLLIKHNLLRAYLWINFVYTVLFFLAHLYFFFQPFILNQLILCIIGISFLKAMAIFLVRLKTVPKLSARPPGNIVTNWLFIGLNEIAGIVARWLDKIYLLYLLSPAEFAIFFNGAFEIPLFGILISAMENIMLTNISADISNKPAAVNIFKESFKILSLIAFLLFFFLLTMHAETFSVVFKDRYNASIPVFLVSIFIIPIRITHYGVILQCYGQSKKIVLGSLMDIGLSLVLMIILYPLAGTPGVALAIVISTYLQAAYYTWQSAMLIQVKINDLVPLNFLLKLLVALTFLYGTIYYVKDFVNNAISLAAVFVITCSIIAGGLIIYWKRHTPQQVKRSSGL